MTPEVGQTKACEACGNTGLVIAHGAEDYGVSFESEYCEACEFGQALVRIDQLEAELHDVVQQRDLALRKTDEMARQLAITVRWGTGVNLQARSARKMLDRHGYTLDAVGWLEDEAGYDPDAPPWREGR